MSYLQCIALIALIMCGTAMSTNNVWNKVTILTNNTGDNNTFTRVVTWDVTVRGENFTNYPDDNYVNTTIIDSAILTGNYNDVYTNIFQSVDIAPGADNNTCLLNLTGDLNIPGSNNTVNITSSQVVNINENASNNTCNQNLFADYLISGNNNHPVNITTLQKINISAGASALDANKNNTCNQSINLGFTLSGNLTEVDLYANQNSTILFADATGATDQEINITLDAGGDGNELIVGGEQRLIGPSKPNISMYMNNIFQTDGGNVTATQTVLQELIYEVFS